MLANEEQVKILTGSLLTTKSVRLQIEYIKRDYEGEAEAGTWAATNGAAYGALTKKAAASKAAKRRVQEAATEVNSREVVHITVRTPAADSVGWETTVIGEDTETASLGHIHGGRRSVFNSEKGE